MVSLAVNGLKTIHVHCLPNNMILVNTVVCCLEDKLELDNSVIWFVEYGSKVNLL